MPVRWACPPWYGCRCHGKPVSRTTMLTHRREANRVRRNMRRGVFKWGPKILDFAVTEVHFECEDKLEEHPTDSEQQSNATSGVLDVDVGDSVEIQLPALETDTSQAYSRGIASSHAAHCEEMVSGDDMVLENIVEEAGTAVMGLPQTPVPNANAATFRNGISLPGNLVTPSFQQGGTPLCDIPHCPDDLNDQNELSDDTSQWPPMEMENSDISLDDAPFEETIGLNPSGVGGTSANLGALEWVKEQRAWVALFYKHGLEYTVMDDILHILKAPMKSWKTVVANVCRQAGLQDAIENYKTCPGHMCFAQLSQAAEVCKCSDCGMERPSLNATDGGSVSYLPLLPRIEPMLKKQHTCEKLFQYHQSFHRTPGIHCDFFDSAAYDRLCSKHGGTEQLKWDIFISASTDGFQAYKNRSLDVWPVLAILLNLPPDERCSVRNVLPMMFVPDGKQPANLQSFLIPLINEVNSTQPHGIAMKMYDGTQRNIRFHLVWFSTDLDGLNKVAALNGQNGKTPCRYCLVQGVYSTTSRHYYYPCSLRIGNNVTASSRYNPASLPSRSVESIQAAITSTTAARSVSERTAIAKETGIKGASVLSKVVDFVPYRSFPPDIMHLFYNVQKHLLDIQTADYNDLFSLSPQDIDIMDSELIAFASGISGQMARAPRALSQFQTWKAAEHKQFTLSYCLILFDGYLPELYLNGLELFVMIVELCFLPSLATSDVNEISSLAIRFVKHFETHFMRHNRDRLKMSTYIMHLLLHLAEGVREHGPLVNSSQYWVEQYIGWLVDRLNARRVPAASMRNGAIFCESYKIFFDAPFLFNDEEDSLQLSEDGFKLLGPMYTEDLHNMEDGGRALRDQLARYFIRKYEGMQGTEAKRVAANVDRCVFWSRVRFLCGRTTMTASTESRGLKGRPSHFIAVEMDETDSRADVYYGKLVKLLEFHVSASELDIANRFPDCKGHHAVAVIQWARPLLRGRQRQIYVQGRRRNAFSAATTEDVSIIKRLIGVVEHSVPSVTDERHSRRMRTQQRTYFMDFSVRVDHLLEEQRCSDDGVNRRLRGLVRSG